MICTKCNEPIEEKMGYCRTKKGAHHFRCGVENRSDGTVASQLTDELLKANVKCAKLVAALREAREALIDADVMPDSIAVLAIDKALREAGE